MKTMLSLALLPFVVMVTPQKALEPGVVMVTRSTVLQSGETWVNTISVQDGDILMEFAESGGRTGSMVFLADGEELILNDDEKRSFIRVDREFVEGFAEMMAFATEQMQRAFEAMPEAQREMMMQAAGGAMPGRLEDTVERRASEIRETGVSATKDGHPATRYDVYMNDLLMSQMWISDWSRFEHGEELRRAFGGLTSLFESFEEVTGQSPFGGGTRRMVGTLERGVPVETIDFDLDGTASIETVLESVTEAEVDRSAFGPKDGYREERVEAPRVPGR